ncbi:MAG: cell envelope biogenesis protein OmpA, partial [Pseudomonadota bacterium]
MIHSKLKRWAVYLTALCLWVGMPLATSAQNVTLSFPDGSFAVTGPLLGFDGQSYRVDTRFGVLTIAADSVTCSGTCPSSETAPIIRLAGSPLMADLLVPALVDAFARSQGLAAMPMDVGDGVGFQLASSNREELALFIISGAETAAGFEALSRNEVDIVLADRHPTPAERK